VATYQGVTVDCARYGQDYLDGFLTPVRGEAPAVPAVPMDAVTASGGPDPRISLAYARLQAPRVARQRGVDVTVINALVDAHTIRRFGFLSQPTVDVQELNADMDRQLSRPGV
jgi:K+-transporting ATPase ATPase C chain